MSFVDDAVKQRVKRNQRHTVPDGTYKNDHWGGWSNLQSLIYIQNPFTKSLKWYNVNAYFMFLEGLYN